MNGGRRQHEGNSPGAAHAGTPGMWDERGAGHPSVFLNPHSGLLHILYQGSTNAGIGMAVMEEQGDLQHWRKVSPSQPQITALPG